MGAIVSGVQVAISASNTGGAWDNCKKEIEKRRAFREKCETEKIDLKEAAKAYSEHLAADGGPFQEGEHEMITKGREQAKWKDLHVAAVVGDTVGDPLKDTSGPAINILVKLSAITSLVFGNYLAHYHFFGNQPAPIRYAKELLAYC